MLIQSPLYTSWFLYGSCVLWEGGATFLLGWPRTVQSTELNPAARSRKERMQRRELQRSRERALRSFAEHKHRFESGQAVNPLADSGVARDCGLTRLLPDLFEQLFKAAVAGLERQSHLQVLDGA